MMKTGNGVPLTRSRAEACRESKENIPLGPPEKKRKLFLRDDYPKQTPALKYNGREALSVLSTKQPVEEAVQAVSVNGPEECEETLMTTSEVEALINMKMAGKAKTDSKGRMDQMMDYIKKLRACARQFLQKEAGYILQKGQLMDQIEEQRRTQEEIVFGMKLEKGKLEDDLTQLKLRCSTLEAELGTANAERKELLMVHDKDSEALRIAGEEKSKLSNQIDKLKNELSTSNDQIKSLHDINKRLTEYNTSLQVYNSKLQTDAAAATEENMKTKQEKAAIVETLSAVRGSAAAFQTQLDSAKESLLEGTKQRNALNEELERVHGELQHVIENRDQCMSQIQALTEENARFKEFTGKSTCELEILSTKATALEESYMSQTEQIKSLRLQLDVANQKLKMADASFEQQKREEAGYLSTVEDLQARLAEAEHQLHEGELLQRKLHNTIQLAGTMLPCNPCLSQLQQLCGNDIGGRVWIDICFMRYDNFIFFSDVKAHSRLILHNPQTVKGGSFQNEVMNLLSNLIDKILDPASKGSAAKSAPSSYSDSDSVFGMVECWRDFLMEHCK